MDRRWLPGVVALTLALHAAGMVRSDPPAQDGLKFLRIARQFQSEPWLETIRGSDQHPLYSVLTAMVQPLCATAIGNRSESWRLAGQSVSLIAYLLTLVPIHGWTKLKFGERTANLAVLIFVLLPTPAELGRDVLSDATALCAFAYAVWLGELALAESGDLKFAMGSGLAIAIGYWVRPEVALAAVGFFVAAMGRGWRPRSDLGRWRLIRRVAAFGLVAIVGVGSYVWAKGELTEKLAALQGLASANDRVSGGLRLPPGLDDPSWDFSPKEESGRTFERGDWASSCYRVGELFCETLGWVFLPSAAIGAVLSRPKRSLSLLVPLLIGAFVALLVYQAARRGYVSNRHALVPSALIIPWAAYAIRRLHSAFTRWAFAAPAWRRGWSRTLCGSTIVVASIAQLQSSHPTRWGHCAAGRWIADRAEPGDAVLDTRGWANFAAGRSGYDYWHVQQALTDSRLKYIVVDAEELRAASRRAATLRALLDRAGREVAAFPNRRGESGKDVLVYRFERPACWEAMPR